MTDFFQNAEHLARLGMARALDNAERTVPNWADLAYSFLLSFARSHETFISEDVSAASRGVIPQPPTDRAWGSVYRRAAAAGIIAQDGTGRSARRHNSICPKWASKIFSKESAS